MKPIELKNYIFAFEEQKVVVSKKSIPRWHIILSFCITNAIALLLCVFPWFSSASISDVVMIPVILIPVWGIVVSVDIITIKSAKTFKITISPKGIEHVDWNKTYFIPWESVMSFGVITDCPVGCTRTDGYGDCIFFKNAYMTRKKLKKRMWRIDGSFNRYASTDHVIVFDLKEKDEQEILYQKICEYIYPYCDKDKEFKCSWKDL